MNMLEALALYYQRQRLIRIGIMNSVALALCVVLGVCVQRLLPGGPALLPIVLGLYSGWLLAVLGMAVAERVREV